VTNLQREAAYRSSQYISGVNWGFMSRLSLRRQWGKKKKTTNTGGRESKQTNKQKTKVTTHQKASAMDSNSPAQRVVSARYVDGLIAKVVSEDDSRRRPESDRAVRE
jgi:hypothetical protein